MWPAKPKLLSLALDRQYLLRLLLLLGCKINQGVDFCHFWLSLCSWSFSWSIHYVHYRVPSRCSVDIW